MQYFINRYLDNQLARFISVDKYTLKTSRLLNNINNPQNLNSYSYSLNNPLAYIDNDGNNPFLLVGFVLAGIFLQNIQPAQAPSSNENVNPDPQEREFADLYIPGYENLSWGEKLGLGLVTSGLTSKVEQSASRIFVKSIDRWVSKDAALAASKGVVQKYWSKATFNTAEDSILYHYDKQVVQQGIDKSVYQYTSDAKSFWNANSKWIGAKDSPVNIKYDFNLGNGSTGYKIKDNNTGWGGIYTKEGDIVSFFYN